MNALFQAIAECLTGKDSADDVNTNNAVNDKKNHHLEFNEARRARTTQDIATEVINTMYTAEKRGRDFEEKINNIVTKYGWTESIATAVLTGLENALKKGTAMGQVMKDAFDTATNAATTFASDHPVYCTIIALGILVVLAPWVIEAIGFGELGPIEGSYAALWQARYAGYVPKGSLFSFFQRLGMVWKVTGLQLQS